MPRTRASPPKDFLMVLVISQALFASLVLLVEVAGQSRWFPMTIFPNDHKDSWAKVILYCSGAFLSVFVVWLFTTKKPSNNTLPSLKLVLLPGAVLTLSSVLVWHYLSVWGWCCESRPVFYFGFPFSFLLGIGDNYSSLLPYKTLNLFEVLSSPHLTDFWRIYPYQLFLDFLFWTNAVLVFICLIRWLSDWRSSSIEPVRG